MARPKGNESKGQKHKAHISILRKLMMEILWVTSSITISGRPYNYIQLTDTVMTGSTLRMSGQWQKSACWVIQAIESKGCILSEYLRKLEIADLCMVHLLQIHPSPSPELHSTHWHSPDKINTTNESSTTYRGEKRASWMSKITEGKWCIWQREFYM